MQMFSYKRMLISVITRVLKSGVNAVQLWPDTQGYSAVSFTQEAQPILASPH